MEAVKIGLAMQGDLTHRISTLLVLWEIVLRVGGWTFSLKVLCVSSRNSDSGKTSSFKRIMPVHLNPEIVFSTAAAFRYAALNNSPRWSTVLLLAG